MPPAIGQLSKLDYPRPPSELAAQLAKDILRGRFMADHKDYNRMLANLRERNLDVQLAFFGDCARDAIPVVEAVAMENLRSAPLSSIERKISMLRRQIGTSLAASHAKVDITRLGGKGAAGRQRDHARASEQRNITAMYIERLSKEIQRRKSFC